MEQEINSTKQNKYSNNIILMSALLEYLQS